MGHWAWGLSGWVVVISVILSQLSVYTTSIYLHRSLAHRSVYLRPGTRFFFRLVLWLFLGSDPREWVAAHRLHHAFVDTERDPYSPLYAGLWGVGARISKLIREACRDRRRVERLTRDLPPDPFERLPFGRRFGGITLTLTAMVLLAGPFATAWIVALTVGQNALMTTIVNGLAHLPGLPVSGQVGRNLALFAPITAGEALHANHHAAPGRLNLRFRKGQVDPGWWVILVMSKLRMAAPREAPVRDAEDVLAARREAEDRARVAIASTP
jgi:stearoyl-CoA desaturase (delta-9 desaturase)